LCAKRFELCICLRRTGEFAMKGTMAVMFASALLATAGAMELTKDNWDDAVAGKTVFVKFQAPW